MKTLPTIDELVLAPVSDLKNPVARFNFSEPPVSPDALAELLVDLLSLHKGIGLAANQVGLPYNALVIGDVFGNGGQGNFVVMFNPTIVHSSGKLVELEEACISFPGVLLKIKRPTDVRVRWQNEKGVVDTSFVSGLTARVIQHEIDHLQGIPFTERVSKLKRDIAMRKASKNVPRQIKASDAATERD